MSIIGPAIDREEKVKAFRRLAAFAGPERPATQE